MQTILLELLNASILVLMAIGAAVGIRQLFGRHPDHHRRRVW